MSTTLPALSHASGAAAARPLRAWQHDALEAYFDPAREDCADFLVTATPGAGKTTFALTLARRLLDSRRVDRVVVVAPTDHLRTQWADAAHRMGIELDPTMSNAVGPVRPDMQGYVTTYAQVAGHPMLHRARATAKRSLVVLDEIHHAGDGLSWGEAVREAFADARRRLSLTGTPFRTKVDERIPFVSYVEDDSPESEGGLCSRADYTYGYRQALADGVVRPVVFAAYTGTSRWRNSAGEVIAASLTEPSTKSVEALAWRTALDPRGDWVPHVIAAMDERLTHLREYGMHDAAGLVLASDQDDARAYAKIVQRVTGEKPALILSDDPKASAKIKEFAEGDQRYAVCVRMISEGVDVPRAACLAWMTSYRTPLFFAQAVGRVVRARTRGESATVFLPAVRPLLALAAELETDRNHVIAAPAPGEALPDPGELDALPVERAEGGPKEFEALEAQAEFAHVLHGGRAVTAGLQPLDSDAEDFLGLPGLLSPEQTAALLAQRDAEIRKRTARVEQPGLDLDGAGTEDVPEPAEEDATWHTAALLRKEIHGLVGRVAAGRQMPHASVYAKLRSAVPGPPSASAPVELLRRRRDHLLTLV
ncbi:superfamily II DNA or RNA helicase [Kineococcus xinjiangensis]|uniref:Superfamily II DNA or RNA helicase n=1 Tax=Kineococcus xinjiangensis TaxID=512762 RepID=A0A2S6ICV4_9ACTN|nr:DEAD/DEAH box helicase family protein [Kineococcus xinjiangensis]PPK92003.1 superfamily II DNA or RNA helicase [Kineococcus xinjiangensis]